MQEERSDDMTVPRIQENVKVELNQMWRFFYAVACVDFAAEVVLLDPGLEFAHPDVSCKHLQWNSVVSAQFLIANLAAKLDILVPSYAAQRAQKVLETIDVASKGVCHKPFSHVMLEGIHIP